MSFILDAIKKAEREREFIQFIDYKNNDKINYKNNDKVNYKNNSKKRELFYQKKHFWLWISGMLALNMLLWGILLLPKEPLAPPQVYFVPSVTPNEISLPTAKIARYQSPTNSQSLR
jgi:hypothetical protein